VRLNQHKHLAHLVVDERPIGLSGAAAAVFSPCELCGPDTTVVNGGRCANCSTPFTHRYVLTRYWGDEPAWVFVMLNPSTADAYVLDPTVRRCIGFARAGGAGGVMVLNAFALRSTDPRVLRTAVNPVGVDNDAAIAAALWWRTHGPVVVAWGVHAKLGRRDEKLLAVLQAGGIEPYRLGPTTKDGHPRHPLYLPGDSALEPHPLTCWDTEDLPARAYPEHDWSQWTDRPAGMPPGNPTRLRYCGRCNLYQGERGETRWLTS
jgi:hypothetical protein